MLPTFKPLPYKTPEELIAAFLSGVKFYFVRTTLDTAEPVLQMHLVKLKNMVRCLDEHSKEGDNFNADGSKGSNRIFLSLYGEEPTNGTKITAPDTVTASDKAGIAAMPVPAPISPAPPFMVALPKSADGLGIVHNPDKKFVWGAQ
jgi:hypothetical protein